MIVWGRLAEIVRGHGAAALVSVHEARGSAPRDAGARMVVRPDGAFHGTIGGGRLEWEALDLARRALSRGRGPARLTDHALGPDLGQCCGGRVRLLIETFDARDLADMDALAAREAEGGFEAACHLDDGGRVTRTRSAIPSPRGRGEGFAPLAGGEASPQGEGEGGYPEEPRSGTPPHPGAAALALSPDGGGDRAWTERHGEDRVPLLLFGAGHVGRALVLALAPLPFAVRWIDGRDDAFPAAMPANVTPVRSDAPDVEVAAAPPGAFVLVMTHDHALDLAITAAALKNPDLPFVGLIGSATKRARFEKRLRELAIPEERIGALACPIGVPGIAGKEPAVIAASVAAQLLAMRERMAGLRGLPSPTAAEPARTPA